MLTLGPANSTEEWKMMGRSLRWRQKNCPGRRVFFTANLRHSSKWSVWASECTIIVNVTNIYSLLCTGSKEWEDWGQQTRESYWVIRCSTRHEAVRTVIIAGRWITFEENSDLGKKLHREKTHFLRFSACLGEIPLVDSRGLKRQ